MFEPIHQPVVAAAIVAGIVAVASLIVNSLLNTRLHRERVDADTKLAQRKFDYERSLSETRILREKELQLWRTRVEFSENALRQFYEAQVRVNSIRRPVSFNYENNDRIGRDKETETQRSARDKYYPVISRLSKEAAFVNEVLTNRFRAMALFGEDASKPYEKLLEVLTEIQGAAEFLMYDLPISADDETTKKLRADMQRTIWGRPNDALQSSLVEMRKQAERLYEPHLRILQPD